jgi:TRAP-type C4-dicarboxylate transport system permease small subunit
MKEKDSEKGCFDRVAGFIFGLLIIWGGTEIFSIFWIGGLLVISIGAGFVLASLGFPVG